MAKAEEIESIVSEFEKITQAAVENAEGRDGFYTVSEMIELTGFSKNAILARLRKLQEAGRLEVKDIKKMNIAGRANSVPVYRIKPQAVEKKVGSRKTKTTNKT